MSVSITQLHPMFVGEVAGVRLAPDLAPATVKLLEDAINEYSVLIFHDQDLRDDETLFAVGKLFGVR